MRKVGALVDREWLWLTLAAAALVTALDAALLQLRRDYFTGGFLSIDHASAWSDRLAFVVGSVATDMALAGIAVAAALAFAAWRGLGWVPRWFLALAAGAGPLLVASVIQYQVLAHLGDAFDFGLMFNLVGRRPAEILAVAAGHLVAPSLLFVAAMLAVGALTWWLSRRFTAGRRTSRLALVTGPLIVALLGASTMTAQRLASSVLDNGLRRKPAGQLLGSFVGTVTDVDRDGYGLLSRPADPDPWDARVYPYALEVPGNGVDENGIAGDLPVGPPYREPPVQAPDFSRRPPLLIVMLESFRADLLGASVEGREVTPVLNALVAGGRGYTAYSHNGYTVQSKHHLFTGSLAGLRGGTTVIDDFARNGYEVAYFSAQDESFGGPRYDVGTSRVDLFYDARQDRDRRYTTFATPGSLGVSSNVVLERVQAFLSERDTSRPLLLYVSLYDTHYPYHHPAMEPLLPAPVLGQTEIVPSRAADVMAMYRNAAANVDAAVGRLVDAVTARLGQPPAVVVLADHGESLFDEGFLGHGYALNDVQTGIPLIAHGLPLSLCTPAGQADVRDAIIDALRRPDAPDASGVLACDGSRVFQYLGTIESPRQIGFVSGSGRLVHDIPRDRVRFDEGEWMRPSALDEAQRRSWLELAYFWERLQLAQAAAREAVR